MPAEGEELEDLIAEGNVLQELATPVRVFLKDGRAVGLECVRNRLGEPGADGRRRPIPIADSAFTLNADAIIVAIGQQPDIAFLDGGGVSLRRNGSIAVDSETGLAGTDCVYAGGDVVRGPATIIQACADGRRAAKAICQRFGIPFRSLPDLCAHPDSSTSSLRRPVKGRSQALSVELSGDEILQVKRARARRETQHRPKSMPVDQRGGFDLVEHTLTEDAARREAARCLQCGSLCDKCVEVCPNRANYAYSVSPVSLTLPQLSCRNGELVVTGQEPFRVEQTRQIVHIVDFCNECGNCATFCVHQGKPYLDKPRLFLREDDFERENDNAYYIKGDTIRQHQGGRESRLSVKDGILFFENTQVRASLSSDLRIIEMALIEAFNEIASLKEIAEMSLILKGITTSLPFLF
jgi:putative selenate reductase